MFLHKVLPGTDHTSIVLYRSYRYQTPSCVRSPILSGNPLKRSTELCVTDRVGAEISTFRGPYPLTLPHTARFCPASIPGNGVAKTSPPPVSPPSSTAGLSKPASPTCHPGRGVRYTYATNPFLPPTDIKPTLPSCIALTASPPLKSWGSKRPLFRSRVHCHIVQPCSTMSAWCCVNAVPS